MVFSHLMSILKRTPGCSPCNSAAFRQFQHFITYSGGLSKGLRADGYSMAQWSSSCRPGRYFSCCMLSHVQTTECLTDYYGMSSEILLPISNPLRNNMLSFVKSYLFHYVYCECSVCLLFLSLFFSMFLPFFTQNSTILCSYATVVKVSKPNVHHKLQYF